MTASSRLLLVEGWSERIERRPGDLVVALTAESLQDLRDRGIAHMTAEQFGFEERLSAADRRLWPLQIDWLKRVGDLIAVGTLTQQREAQHFPWAYGWPLKGFVDRLIVANEECEAVLAAVGRLTVSIHLYEDPHLAEAKAEVFDGWPDGARARRVVWQQASRELGLSFTVDHGETPAIPAKPIFRVAKSIVDASNRRRRGLFALPSSVAPIVFLQRGPDLDPAISELTSQGCLCLLAEEMGAKAVRLRPMAGMGRSYSKAVTDVTWTPDSAAWHKLFSQAAAFLPARVIEPLQAGLISWLGKRVPRYLSLAAAGRELLTDAGVGAVVASHVTSDVGAAFIGAAASRDDVESALIAHGDSPAVAPVWDLHELKPFKHYFTPNRESAEYFEQRRGMLGNDAAEVHVASNRWAEYRTWRGTPWPWLNRWDYSTPRLRTRSPLALRRKPLVVYISSTELGHHRYLSKPAYTEIVNHDLQVAICGAMSARTDIDVVLKLYPGHRRNSAIERHLRALGSPVRVSRAPMRHWFPSATAVIVDCPSTSLYQAALAGVPALGLLYSGFEFRPAALAEFAGQTRPFNCPREAAELVTTFLRRIPLDMPEARPSFESGRLMPQLLGLTTRNRQRAAGPVR